MKIIVLIGIAGILAAKRAEIGEISGLANIARRIAAVRNIGHSSTAMALRECAEHIKSTRRIRMNKKPCAVCDCLSSYTMHEPFGRGFVVKCASCGHTAGGRTKKEAEKEWNREFRIGESE